MSVSWVHFLLEERSTEMLLRTLVPRMAAGLEADFFSLNGKDALLRDLPARLRGYRSYLQESRGRLVIVVDRDQDDCVYLKTRIAGLVEDAGLTVDMQGTPGTVLIRVAVEEMEAWLLGDVSALREEFPRVPASLAQRSRFRDVDDIRGGTWEALERVLQEAGSYPGGLAKVDCALRVARHMNIHGNRSHSFAVFQQGLQRLIGAA